MIIASAGLFTCGIATLVRQKNELMFVSKVPNQYLEGAAIFNGDINGDIGDGYSHSNDEGIKLATELLQVFLNEKAVVDALLGRASSGKLEFLWVVGLLSGGVCETLGILREIGDKSASPRVRHKTLSAVDNAVRAPDRRTEQQGNSTTNPTGTTSNDDLFTLGLTSGLTRSTTRNNVVNRQGDEPYHFQGGLAIPKRWEGAFLDFFFGTFWAVIVRLEIAKDTGGLATHNEGEGGF